MNEKRSKCNFQHFDYGTYLSPSRKFSEINSVHENKELNNSDSFDFLRMSEKLSESKVFHFQHDDFQTHNHFFTNNNFISKAKKRCCSLNEIKRQKEKNEKEEEEVLPVLKKTKSFSLELIKTENERFSEVGSVLHVIKELKNNIVNFSQPVNHKRVRSLLTSQEFNVLYRNPSNLNQDCSTQFPEESTISRFTIEPLSTAEQTPTSVSPPHPHVEEKISEIIQYLKRLHKSNISFLIRYNEVGRPMVKVGGGYLTLDNYLSNLIQKMKSRAESYMEPDALEKLTDYLEFVKKIDFKKEFNKQNHSEKKKSSHAPTTSKSRFNFVKAVVIEKEKNEKIADLPKTSAVKDRKKIRRSMTSDVSQFSLNDSFRLSITKTNK